MPDRTPSWLLSGGQPPSVPTTPTVPVLQPQSAGATAPPSSIDALFNDPKFVLGSYERRREMAKEFERTTVPAIAAANNLTEAQTAALAKRARDVLKPALPVPKYDGLIANDLFDLFTIGAANTVSAAYGAIDPSLTGAEYWKDVAREREAKNLSDGTRNERLRAQELKQEAKARGGEWAAAGQTGKNFIAHPLNSFSEFAGNAAPVIAAGALAAPVATALGVSAPVATGLGLLAGGLTGAGIEFGGARNQTYELAQTLPLEVLAQNPDIAERMARGDSEESIRKFAGEDVNIGHWVASIAGFLEGTYLGRIPGAKAGIGPVANAIGKVTRGWAAPGTRMAAGLEGAVTGTASGAISQAGTNRASQPLDPSISTWDDVASSAVQEALGVI